MKLPGPWRGVVEDNNDPLKMGRLRVSIPGYFDDGRGRALVTPWALPAWSSFRHDIPAKGEGVWVMFEAPAEGPDNPIWIGRYPSLPKGISEIPGPSQQDVTGDAPYGRGLYSATTTDFSNIGGHAAVTIQEPESFQASTYPFNHVCETPGGYREENDDTAGDERISRRLGVFDEEITKTGTVSTRAAVKLDFIIEREARLVDGDQQELVGGNSVRTVEGNCNSSVLGSTYLKTGSIRATLGSMTLTVDDNSVFGTEIKSGGTLLLKAIGEAMLSGRNALVFGLDAAEVVSGGSVNVAAMDGTARLTGASGITGVSVVVNNSKAQIVDASLGSVLGVTKPVLKLTSEQLIALEAWFKAVGAGLSVPVPYTQSLSVTSKLESD